MNTIAEMAGGLLAFAAAAAAVALAAEAACRLFFWIREREKEGK
jgi:hypothetical protein